MIIGIGTLRIQVPRDSQVCKYRSQKSIFLVAVFPQRESPRREGNPRETQFDWRPNLGPAARLPSLGKNVTSCLDTPPLEFREALRTSIPTGMQSFGKCTDFAADLRVLQQMRGHRFAATKVKLKSDHMLTKYNHHHYYTPVVARAVSLFLRGSLFSFSSGSLFVCSTGWCVLSCV